MTKISSLTALSGSAVDDAADLLPIVDMSEAGAARNKKITIDETRIALGLSSADSPQFTAINLGHASDTTITRVSAGVAAIEGVNIVTTAGGVTFAADIIVPDEAYDATAWNGSLEVPTKNAVRDKIETLAAGSGITVEDEGVSEGTGITTLNFTGAGVSVTVAGAEAEVIVAGGGGGIDIEDEGAAESTGATVLNFVGAGVTANDAGGGQTDITIPGGALVVLGSDSTVSSGVLEVTGLTLTDYCEVIVVLEDVTFSAAGVPALTCYVGAAEVVTGYYYAHRSISSGGSTESAAGANVANIGLLDGTSSGPWYPATGADDCYGGEITFITPTSGNHKVFRFWGISSQGSTGATVDCDGGGALRNTGTIDGFKLSSGGTISAGRMVVLGRKRA